MGKQIQLLGANKGLNNKIAPEYLPLGENGFEYVSEAVNVDSDDSGRLSRRNGYNPTSITSSCHSLFSNNRIALYVIGDALSIINPDNMQTQPIRQVTPGARMSYIDAPPHRVYYANGYEIGYVEGGKSHEWVMQDVLVKDGKTPDNPPVGHLLEIFNGYVFIACVEDGKNVVYHSMPFSPHSYDFGKSFFVYPDFTTLLGSVDDGIYIGTERELYFLQGGNPKDFIQIKKNNIAPLRNSMVKTNTKELGMESSNNCIIFSTNSGIYGAFRGGEVVQFTSENIKLQDNYKFADAYIKDSRYIVSFKK